MTKETLAAKLTGREYREEIDEDEAIEAREHGLVVVFGYSDDNVEFRGAFEDEIGCYDGGEVLVNKDGALPCHEDRCECKFCGYEVAKKSAHLINCVWNGNDGEYAWIYETKIPHATFDILKVGGKFCRGIVFSTKDL